MKKRSDPRHQKRVDTTVALFEYSFQKNQPLRKDSAIKQITAKLKGIDKQIEKNAPAWPIEQIAPIDLAILRLATWELLYKIEKEPYKVIIDEAVEIAKEFGSESSPSFINGVLGSIIKTKPKQTINDQQ